MKYNAEELFVGKVEFASFIPGKACFTNNRYIFKRIKQENGESHLCQLISQKSFYPITDDECFFVRAVKMDDFADIFPGTEEVTEEDIILLESIMYSKDNDLPQTKKRVVNK